MDRKLWDSLERGDIVRHKETGNSFVITGVVRFHGERKWFFGERTIQITNPEEWTYVERPKTKSDA